MSQRSTLRKLQIDAQIFLYRIVPLDDNYIKLKVWSSIVDDKENFIQVQIRFDDPWRNFQAMVDKTLETQSRLFLQPVTPSQVRRIIAEAIAKGWDLQAKRQAIFFNWQDEQLLKTTETL